MVRAHPNSRGSEGRRAVIHAWLMTSPAPLTRPKQINVHPAPCHSPERKKVSSIGNATATINSEPALGCCWKNADRRRLRRNRSHRGVYTYIVKNRVIVICQRFQNSVIDVAV